MNILEVNEKSNLVCRYSVVPRDNGLLQSTLGCLNVCMLIHRTWILSLGKLSMNDFCRCGQTTIFIKNTLKKSFKNLTLSRNATTFSINEKCWS